MDEITAEYATDQLVAATELRFRTKVSMAAKTDLGRVRENNEDKFDFFASEDEKVLASKGQVFVVCDGMGGHAAGQIASELSAKTFIDVYMHYPSEDPIQGLISGVKAANRFVCDIGRSIPARRGMGTTLSGLVILQDKAYTVQVGDSRVYRLRGETFEQLTIDHSWVEEVVRAGIMSRGEAENHPNKHVIMRAIGIDGAMEPDVSAFDLEVGDLFLICSDGLLNHVDDARIAAVLQTSGLAEATWKLVGEALQGGGSDNTTVMLVRVDAIEPNDS